MSSQWVCGGRTSPVSERQRKDTGCDLLNAETPPCIVSTTRGDIWHWQYSPVLRSPSSFSSSELCSIEALPAHSHANTQKAGADVKHLVLFLFTCKEIMCPVIIISLFFVLLRVIKKESSWWRASSLVARLSAACGEMVPRVFWRSEE